MTVDSEKPSPMLLPLLAEACDGPDKPNMTGVFGQLAHGAWHLGAIRQGLGLIALPPR